MHGSIERRYLEHLTDHDLALLAAVERAPGPAGADPVRALRADPARAARLLAEPATAAAVFGPGAGAGAATGTRRDDEPFLRASPFLAFAVALHRAAADLATARFTAEWVGPRQRVPVFDAHELRDFAADPRRLLFLVELLASYTHVASGSTVVRTSRGLRRRRFSELDPVRLAGLLEVVGEAERPGVLRRMGDCALFLTGVFPDHTAVRGVPPIDRSRLLRAADHPAGRGRPGPAAGVPAPELPESVAASGGVGLLEHLGARWYRLAVAAAPVATDELRVVGEVGERFRTARRILNLVTDTHLLPARDRWFGSA